MRLPTLLHHGHTETGSPTTHHHDHDHGHDHGHGDHQHDHGHGHGEEAGSEEALVAGRQLVDLLYIDPVAGASGDMFLGALVDLGVDFHALTHEVGKLGVKGFDLRRSEAKRHTIAGTKVDVVVEDVPHPHRHLGDLLAIIDKADLAPRVKERSRAVLTKLAEAESQAHRMPIEKVHLHEVGGLDCLVDVVGTCVGLELLAIDHILSGPVTVGTGTVACAHGRMPLPAPGTLAILRDYPVRKTTTEGEMTTPTGAAIIAALAKPVLSPLVYIPRRIGYGAGTKDKKEIANLLRLVAGQTERRLLAAIG